MNCHPEHDILLCYTVDAFGHIPNDKELFAPAVGYYQDGELKDFMYDSFIFLSSPNYLYDYFPGGYAHKSLNQQDFLNFIGEEMKEGFAIDALNAAVGEAKAKLNRPDYKANVFMSLLYPANTVKEFGVVEGKMRDLSVLEDRLAALRWMADESIRQFNEKHFEHVSLSGFYWFCEEMEYEDQNKEMTQATTAYIRSIGYKTCWCPWFGAPGFEDWKELGFDIATQQANFFPEHRKNWPNRGTEERLPAVAEWTRKIGIGVGMEMSDAEHESAEVFKQYLETGAREGFMHYPHIYYMGRGPQVVSKIYHSEDAYVREVYDELYKYIHRTLKAEEVHL